MHHLEKKATKQTKNEQNNPKNKSIFLIVKKYSTGVTSFQVLVKHLIACGSPGHPPFKEIKQAAYCYEE